MARRGRTATGQLRIHEQTDGTRTFSMRVRCGDERYTVKLGDEADGWSERRAEIELENTMAKIQAGIWEPPDPAVNSPHEQPTMHELASIWLRRKTSEGIRGATEVSYTWRLGNHLLPFFGRMRPSQINDARVEEYMDLKIAERKEILTARAAGVTLRDANGRPRGALSNGAINQQLVTLAAILDLAVRRGWLPRNPARGVRLKTRSDPRSVLEADELWSLIEAAGELDRTVNSAQTLDRGAEVRRLRETKKMAWKQIAKTLGLRREHRDLLLHATRRPSAHPSPGAAYAAGDARRRRTAGHRGRTPQPRGHRPRAPQAPSPRGEDTSGRQGSRHQPLAGPGAQRLPRDDRRAAKRNRAAVPHAHRSPTGQRQHPKPRAKTRARESQRDAREGRQSADRHPRDPAHAPTNIRDAHADRRCRAPLRHEPARPRQPDHDPEALRPGPQATPPPAIRRRFRPHAHRRRARRPIHSVLPTNQHA
jgi:hypothetical protein